jgi:hypothetical protein
VLAARRGIFLLATALIVTGFMSQIVGAWRPSVRTGARS